MNGLGARLRRHCAKTKKIHWHIDYLLTLPEAKVRQIILYPAAPGQECRQNQRIAARAGAVVILKNFGASDCKLGCGSHLFFFAKDCSPKFAEHLQVPKSELLPEEVGNLASDFQLRVVSI
jgi:Uri superfamily endonuclease